MACNSKVAVHTAKRIESGNSEVILSYLYGVPDLLVFNVILGSFGALL